MMDYDAQADAQRLAAELGKLPAEMWPMHLAMALQQVFTNGVMEATTCLRKK